MGAMALKEFVGGNAGVSLALAALVALIVVSNRRRLPRPWRDPHQGWRVIGTGALALQALAFLWVSLFDYWRPLMGLLLTDKTRVYSDPYTIAPVLADHGVGAPTRAVSLALLALAALGLALLFHRHVGGLFLPLALSVIGGLLYAILGDARWRLDIWAANGFPQVGRGTAGDLLVDLAFFLPLVVFVAALALAQYLTFAALVALPTAIVAGLLEARLARPTPEYRQFSAALSRHAAAARDAHQAREQGPQRDERGAQREERRV